MTTFLLSSLAPPPYSGYISSVEGMDAPSIVYVNTMIRSISKIDDYKMVREYHDPDLHKKDTSH